MDVKAIGHIENDFEPGVTADRRSGSTESRIVLDPDLADGLQGLESGQSLVVMFWFHLTSDYELLQHPRGDTRRPVRGVFALRSPRRPCPIGVTEVEIIGRDGNVLRVRGLDAFNGTPVLDLKPAGK